MTTEIDWPAIVAAVDPKAAEQIEQFCADIDTAQIIGPEEHPCDKCGVQVSELEYHGRDKPDGTSEYLCPDCPSDYGANGKPRPSHGDSVRFSIAGVEYRGTVRWYCEDEVDVVDIVPTVDGDDSATLPAAIITFEEGAS